MPTKEQLLNEYLLAAMDTGKVEPEFKRGGMAKKKRYIDVGLLEQEFRHKQKG